MQVLFSPQLNLKNQINLQRISGARPNVRPAVRFCGASDTFTRGIKSASVDLTKYVREELTSPECFEAFLEKFPNASRYLGDVPKSWVRNNLEKAQQICEFFSEFAKGTLTPHFHDLKFDHVKHNAQIQSAARELESKMGSVLGRETKVGDIGAGTYGKVFWLNTGEGVYAIKVFHKYEGKLMEMDYHGKSAEVLNACATSNPRNVDAGRYAPFYFGKFAGDNDNDGFMVTKFIDNTSAFYLNWRDKRLYTWTEYIYPIDANSSNCMEDTIIDFGALTLNEELKNPKKRYFAKRIAKAVDDENIEAIRDLKKRYGGFKEFHEALEYLQDSRKNPVYNKSTDEFLFERLIDMILQVK